MGHARIIVAGNLIDGSGAGVRRNVFLKVKDTIITAIGPAADLSHNDRTVIDDLSHCTIVPPLVDCSVTLSRSPALDRRMRSTMEEAGIAAKAGLAAQHVRYCHSHGVLGMAASNDSIGLVKHLHEILEPGTMAVIRTSGPLCRSRQDCSAGKPAGADFLKILYTASICVGDVPDPRLDWEYLRSILRRRGGKKAVVVANGRQPVKEALAAGCDAIEQGYAMGEDNLRQMAATGVLWIPNALMAKNRLDNAGSGGEVSCRFSMRYVAPGKADPGAEIFWKKILAEQLAQLRLARKLGVQTAVGTGAGSVGILHGESMVEEMKLFIKAGWSLEETIRCASATGAGFFNMANLGALAVGRQATFLAARGTAQQLPRKLSYLEAIYIDGAPSIAYRKNPDRPA